MSDPVTERPGVPGLALGAAVLVAERLRRLTSPAGPTERERVQDLLTSGVEPSPVDARSPVAIAIGLTQQSLDLARRTGARVTEATRDQARRLAGATRSALPSTTP